MTTTDTVELVAKIEAWIKRGRAYLDDPEHIMQPVDAHTEAALDALEGQLDALKGDLDEFLRDHDDMQQALDEAGHGGKLSGPYPEHTFAYKAIRSMAKALWVIQ